MKKYRVGFRITGVKWFVVEAENENHALEMAYSPEAFHVETTTENNLGPCFIEQLPEVEDESS